MLVRMRPITESRDTFALRKLFTNLNQISRGVNFWTTVCRPVPTTNHRTFRTHRNLNLSDNEQKDCRHKASRCVRERQADGQYAFHKDVPSVHACPIPVRSCREAHMLDSDDLGTRQRRSSSHSCLTSARRRPPPPVQHGGQKQTGTRAFRGVQCLHPLDAHPQNTHQSQSALRAPVAAKELPHHRPLQ